MRLAHLPYLPHATLLLTTLVTLVGVAYNRTSKGETAASPAASATEQVSRAPGDLPLAGEIAPDFQAVSHTGKPIAMRDLRGHPVVLYFYPKDDTPGCTREASELRDANEALQRAGAVVVGVSTQDNGSHRAFAEKYELPFALLPDTEGRIASRYGVPVQRGMAERVTFLVGKDGRIARVWPKVTPAGHAQQVLDAVRELAGP